MRTYEVVKVGDTFGRLTVVVGPYKGVTPGGRPMWYADCCCECGETRRYQCANLVGGRSTSCGCKRNETTAARNFVHGFRHTPTYDIWCGIKQRCTNPNDAKSFAKYGGRGITICDRWSNSFEAFLTDMGERPEGKSIDRVDNNRGYEPGNCRWATRKEQANNTRANRLVTMEGETHSVAEWADLYHVDYKLLYQRLQAGFALEDALTLLRGVDRITRKDSANSRRTNKLVTLLGETRTVAQWSEVLGVDPRLVYLRLARGMSDEDALLKPKRQTATTKESNIEWRIF